MNRIFTWIVLKFYSAVHHKLEMGYFCKIHYHRKYKLKEWIIKNLYFLFFIPSLHFFSFSFMSVTSFFRSELFVTAQLTFTPHYHGLTLASHANTFSHTHSQTLWSYLPYFFTFRPLLLPASQYLHLVCHLNFFFEPLIVHTAVVIHIFSHTPSLLAF